MKNDIKSIHLKELDEKELVTINGGVDPFTVGLIVGGLIALWRWARNWE
jgi:lactobin A/cerein 7B family class IIb bacteriocin